MSEGTEIRCWAYVTYSFADVSDVIATVLGAPKTLKVNVAGFEIGRDVVIEVTKLDLSRHPPHEPNAPAATVHLQWKAASNASLFPKLSARLMVYPLSAGETQLDLFGAYTPPGGVLGSAADALVMRRFAEESLQRFLDDVVEAINRALVKAS